MLPSPTDVPLPSVLEPDSPLTAEGYKTLLLGGGCFWCLEAVFQQLQGVVETLCGYAGGSETTATYEQVCKGTSGHAEVVKLVYDPAVITRGQLLQIFFAIAHDPTQLNRQGNDRGTQYRSIVFYATISEKQQLDDYLRQLDSLKIWPDPLVTQVEPLQAFYPAEAYHQNFARKNPQAPYIQGIAEPKVRHLKAGFQELLS